MMHGMMTTTIDVTTPTAHKAIKAFVWNEGFSESSSKVSICGLVSCILKR